MNQLSASEERVKYIANFDLPRYHRRLDPGKLKIDFFSTSILKKCGACHYTAYVATGDGNCLYNFISIDLFGHQRFSSMK